MATFSVFPRIRYLPMFFDNLSIDMVRTLDNKIAQLIDEMGLQRRLLKQMSIKNSLIGFIRSVLGQTSTILQIKTQLHTGSNFNLKHIK
jgi:hypothetical protein